MLLMKKNIIVADISMINGSINKINKVYDKEALPAGLYTGMELSEIELDEVPLSIWWKNKSVLFLPDVMNGHIYYSAV